MSSHNYGGFDEGNGGRDIERSTGEGEGIRENVQQKARDFRHRAAQKFDDATTRTGTKVESMGRTTRDKVNLAADRLAEKSETVGAYLQEHDFEAMADDVANVIRRYPVQTVLVGLGIGFMIGRMTSR